jgi:hypothetical protein
MVAGAFLVREGGDDEAGGDATTTSAEVTTTTETDDEQGAEEETAEPVELEPVRDRTGVLTVMVPASWTNRELRPFDDGTRGVIASTNIDGFFRSFDTSGIDFVGFRAGSPMYVTVAAADPEGTTGIRVEMVLTEAGERAALDSILSSLTARLPG